ncbi:hypothetical protein KIN20_029001 [Parelaphostrongylus tenuis]|uniref:Uncharacterized protein n=1 Tax=Parelaphostrongylus tenuis TaxID=148309 RepID=A0AAD5R1M0_PARTN|nr:hypothetical protein KIN20_029001 [Parelaphostrongylus tenuis]
MVSSDADVGKKISRPLTVDVEIEIPLSHIISKNPLGSWNNDDSIDDYELSVERLKRCADLASVAQPSRADSLPLPQRSCSKSKGNWSPILNATHLARFISNTSQKSFARGSSSIPKEESVRSSTGKIYSEEVPSESA